jgi:hypothetical protein
MVAIVFDLQAMGQRQADALEALEVATTDRLNAISVATQQGIINLYQVKSDYGPQLEDCGGGGVAAYTYFTLTGTPGTQAFFNIQCCVMALALCHGMMYKLACSLRACCSLSCGFHHCRHLPSGSWLGASAC